MFSAKNKRALVLAPHTDDAELGAGGTIARLVDEGWKVHVAAFSTCEESLPPGLPMDSLRKEMLQALPTLGVPKTEATIHSFPVRHLNKYRQEVLEEVIRLREKLKPEIVFLPSAQDMHQDHEVVFNEGLRAFKGTTLFGYELPWNHITFNAQAFFAIDIRHLERKCLALNCYASQVSKGRSYFEPKFIEGWARFRGEQIGVKAAEAFEVYRFRY